MFTKSLDEPNEEDARLPKADDILLKDNLPEESYIEL
jgi:hypothetical protein